MFEAPVKAAQIQGERQHMWRNITPYSVKRDSVYQQQRRLWVLVLDHGFTDGCNPSL